VQHVSAHGTPAGLQDDYKITISKTNIATAIADRADTLPPIRLVFAAACATTTPLNEPVPKLAVGYGIEPGARNQVYAGFNLAIYIAGAQAAALDFWRRMAAGATAAETHESAMQAYGNALSRAVGDPDLSAYLVLTWQNGQVDLEFIGDPRTKLRGLYGLPDELQRDQPLLRMLVFGTNQEVLEWF
jgi:hypothetical protein